MDDRFKLKAFHKPTNKLYSVWSVTPFNIILNTLNLENLVVKINECTLMQCTGLKDKNGKLIYEGDILKDKYGALHPISWNIKGFYEADTFAVAGFYNAIQEDMEVIGNIYENKELLNE